MKQTKIKRALLIVCVLLIALSMGACTAKEKTYKADEGITITMADGMEQKTQSGVNVYYEGKDCGVAVIKETFKDFQAYGIDTDTYTLDDYKVLIQKANGFTDAFTTGSDGNPCYSYTTTVSGQDAYYYVTLRKGSDAFWVVSFFCLQKNESKYEPLFEKWAQSIKVQ